VHLVFNNFDLLQEAQKAGISVGLNTFSFP